MVDVLDTEAAGKDEGDAAKLYIGSVTILSFSGAIGLYGFIVALIITSSNEYSCD